MLSQAQLEHFKLEGYLVVDNLLSEHDLDALKREYNEVLDRLCKEWLEQGLIQQDYAELTFENRLVEVFKAGCDYISHMDISLPFKGIKEDSPIHLGEEVFKLLTNPQILSCIESLIGSEIYSNPIQHVRIKPPAKLLPEDRVSSLLRKTSWHQDQAVALPEADETQVITVWLAVNDATTENGCLAIIPRSHREDLTLHCTGRMNADAIFIPDALIDEQRVLPVPIKKGGALFMHSRTQHSSLENNSDHFRWSFDLRYNPVGQATGRNMFPGFVAQSRTNPEQVIRDRESWAKLWLDTRERLSRQAENTYNRWGDVVSELCA